MRAGLCFVILMALQTDAALAGNRKHWVTSWAASVQGPYPSGYSQAQPDLHYVFPTPSDGARDQSFRMIVRPDVWGDKVRVRFSNAFGVRPVTFNDVHVGLHSESSEIVSNTNRPVFFGGAGKITIPPGKDVWSDGISLPFVGKDRELLQGRKLAVSFHVEGASGPMTWHAKALTTSYVTAPQTGSSAASEDEAAFPYSVTSWFFLDAVDMEMPVETTTIVAFGDSLTDGRGATMNGDDRWPNVLSRRLRARFPDRFAVVHAGIAGNRIASPKGYTADNPFPGGPAAVDRLERDVLSLSGVSTVIWLEGTNDLSDHSISTLDDIKAHMKDGVGLIRSRLPHVKIVGSTLTSAAGYPGEGYGSAEYERQRKLLNAFILTSGLFDVVIDFDQATRNPQSGELRPEFVYDTMFGGPGDKLHPNRLGYLAMGAAADIPAISSLDRLATAPPAQPLKDTSRIAAAPGVRPRNPGSHTSEPATLKLAQYRVSLTRTVEARRTKRTGRMRRRKRIVRLVSHMAWLNSDS